MQGDTAVAGAGAVGGNDIASGGGASTSSQGLQNAPKTYIGVDVGSMTTSIYVADSVNGSGPACVKSQDGSGSFPGAIESVVAVKRRANGELKLVVNRYASDGLVNAEASGEVSRLVRHYKLLLAGSSSQHQQAPDFAEIFKLVNGVQLSLMPQRCWLVLAWRCAARVAHALSARPPPEMLCTLMCGSSLAAALQQPCSVTCHIRFVVRRAT